MSTSSRVPQPPTPQILIGTVTGKQFKVNIRPTDTVRDVKERIEENEMIAVESQVLMFGEKTLKDTAAIRDLGIKSGSRLQLAVHMSSGPGPVSRVRKTQKDDSVVVVLCKQSDGMYLLEFHLKDNEVGGVLDKKDAANQLLKLAKGIPPFLLNGDFNFDEEEVADEDEEEEIDEEYFDDESEDACSMSTSTGSLEYSDISRSNSRDSSISTSTFLSMLSNTKESFSKEASYSREGNPQGSSKSKRSSRNSSASTFNQASIREFSSTRTLNKSLTAKRLSTSDTCIQRIQPKIDLAVLDKENEQSTCVIRKKIRPATAISIMRLSKKESGPPFTVEKSRPSTAAAMIQARPIPTKSACVLTKKVRPSTAASIMKMASVINQKAWNSPWDSKPSNAEAELDHSKPVSNGQSFVSARTSTSSKSVQFSPNEKHKRDISELQRNESHGMLETTSSNKPKFLPSQAKKSVRNSPQKREPVAARGPTRKTPPLPQKPSCCFACNKKLGAVAVFKCKCANFFCSTHRYSDRHECKFNYKEAGKALLTKENPKVGGSKVSKI